MLTLVVVSLCAALIAAVLAFLPVGPIAVVVGGVGVATGVVALLRARGVDLVGLAAVTTATVATVLAVVMVASAQLPASASQVPSVSAGGVDEREYRNSDLEYVMSHELAVEFGAVTTGDSGDPELEFAAINKMDIARSFHVTLGAFDGDTQVANSRIVLKLGPRARQAGVAFTDSKISVQKFKSAEFKVVAVQSRFFGV